MKRKIQGAQRIIKINMVCADGLIVHSDFNSIFKLYWLNLSLLIHTEQERWPQAAAEDGYTLSNPAFSASKNPFIEVHHPLKVNLKTPTCLTNRDVSIKVLFSLES